MPADKPAATEQRRGTGSGEPKLADQRCCGCGKRYQEHAGRDNLCYTDGRTLTFVPTPPASPTVTLQRWSFVTDRREGCPVAFTNPNGQWVKYEDALALLRAAKRQQ